MEHIAGVPGVREAAQSGLPSADALRGNLPVKQVTRVAVIIPTYNERDNVWVTVRRVRAAVPDAEVLIVDDNSPDGTGQLADQLAYRDSRIHVLHRTLKDGLGAAYLAGFRWALDRGFSAIVEIDADGSHQPEHLPGLLDALADADLVIGSRWVPGGEVRNWSRSRLLLSRLGNSYARVVLGIGLRDATAGYRVYRGTALQKIALSEVRSRGYCFQVDLALRALESGLTVVEVPITFVERVRGASKMNAMIAHRGALADRMLGNQIKAENRKKLQCRLREPRASEWVMGPG